MIATPNARIEKSVNELISTSPEKPGRLNVVCGQARELMRQADAAMVTSGTATLETALIGSCFWAQSRYGDLEAPAAGSASPSN